MTRVLVVGSNGTTIANFRAALEEGDAHVDLVPDTAAALEELAQQPFDCIVVGSLPAIDPARIETHLRDAGHPLPVVRLDRLEPAEAAARALEKAETTQLDTTRRRRRQANELQSNLTAAVRTCANPDHVARTVCEMLADSPLYHAAWMGQWKDRRGTIVPIAASGVEVGTIAELAEDPEGTVGSRVPVEWEPIVAAEGSHVTIAVPVAASAGPWGVLQVYAHRPGGADTRERDSLEEVGRIAADAMTTRKPPQGEATAEGLGVLGDTLAHELGNQLDAARVQLELARERDGGDHLARVEEALEGIATVAEDARALAGGTVEPESRPLPAAAEEAWAAVGTGGASLSVEDGTVEADPHLLQLLLENLFRNAVQHATTPPHRASSAGDGENATETEKRGHNGAESSGRTREATPGNDQDLTIRVGPLSEGFYVEDDGVGIPPEEREDVFEWGYTTGSSSGAGLGIVSLIADRHGWSAELVDAEPSGARFEFRP